MSCRSPWLSSALLLLAAVAPSCRRADSTDAPLLSLGEARRATGGRVVRVRGRLGLYESATRIGYVQDAGAGLLLEAAPEASVPAVGSTVEVEGIVERLGVAGRLRAQRFHILPLSTLEPEIPIAASLDDPAQEGTWVGIEGVVTEVEERDDKRTHALRIRGEKGSFVACMAEPKDRPVGRTDILGFRVRAQGVRTAPSDPAFAAGCTLRLPSRGFLRILRDAPFSLSPPPPQTAIGAIRALSNADARKRHPVRVRGVVTAYDADKNLLFVQDATGGIYVEAWRHLYDLHAGQAVEIDGWTDGGAFAPIIIWPRLRVTGVAAFPPPRRLETALVPHDDGQWVEVEGVVREARLGLRRAELTLVAFGERLQVDVPGVADPAPVARLVDARVRLRGVYRAKVSATRQVLGVSLSVPSLDLVAVEEAATDPFAATVRRSDSLLDFDPQDTVGHRVHVRGVVTLHQPGRFLYLRDGGGPLRVESREETPLPPGTRVDVVGFPAVGAYRPMLVDASYRARGEQDAIDPRVVAADRAMSGALDGELITIEGRVIERLSPEGERRLVLESALYLFEVALPSESRAFDALPTGSRVRATGVCVVRGEADVPRSFQLLLRSERDVALVQRAPWWNMQRAAVALAGLVAVAAVALLWVIALRRTIREQTAVLRGRLAREAAVEERTRLARELHDSLEQNLAGIGYALQAVKETIDHPRVASSHLDRALRHVDNSMAEARRSVQALRPKSLEGGTLTSALHHLANELTRGGVARSELHVDGEPWPLRSEVEDHLFRIAQEAVTNALKHAAPDHVRLELLFDAGSLQLAVVDDGRGFDTATPIPPAHFGLAGMRERAAAVGGRLTLASVPGEGTTVRIVVLRNHAALSQVG